MNTDTRYKRRLSSFLALVIVFGLLPFFSHTAAAPLSQAPSPQEFVLGEADSGRSVALTQDQILVLRLPANPSTGYAWDVVGMDEQVLSKMGQVEFEPDSDLLGAPGILVLRFAAVGAGQTNLALAYRRPWEGEKPLKGFSVRVQGVGSFSESPPSRTAEPTPVADTTDDNLVISDAKATTALLSAFNWCDQGGCTPVKNQGNCGSCWAFGTVGVLESAIKIQDGIVRDLSEQYLVSCNMEGWDCDGGWWAHDYHQWLKLPTEPAAGAVYEVEMPYVAKDTIACNPPHTHYEKIVNWEYVNEDVDIPSPAEIKQAIYDHGPVAVAICVGDAFNRYNGGVFATSEAWACGGGVNHGVVLVGWDDTQGSNGIWYLKNSWGSLWGESGYMRIAYGTSNVGLGATYVEYESNIHPPAAPTNLRTTSRSQTQINLAWDDNSSDESGFQIERSPNGTSSWGQIAVVGANVTAYANVNLSLSTTYYYRLRAYNGDGNSAYSNILQTRTIGIMASRVYLPVVSKR